VLELEPIRGFPHPRFEPVDRFVDLAGEELPGSRQGPLVLHRRAETRAWRQTTPQLVPRTERRPIHLEQVPLIREVDRRPAPTVAQEQGVVQLANRLHHFPARTERTEIAAPPSDSPYDLQLRRRPRGDLQV